eukprot:9466846-Pyramimonas_sp.AAC.1
MPSRSAVAAQAEKGPLTLAHGLPQCCRRCTAVVRPCSSSLRGKRPSHTAVAYMLSGSMLRR